MKFYFNNNKHLHFVGIGGMGMSGMAELLYNHGFTISGSDITKSNRTKHLSKYKGIKIFYFHKKENIRNCDVVVYSSAINRDNPEIKEAIKQNIPIIKRAELLGELVRVKDISIAIAGTHGKTTTSSMLGSILFEAKKDPTLIIGGIVNKFNSNNISGSGNIIVVEADEFDKSFLALNPTFSIINNLDLEHLDCYKDLDDLLNSFSTFANSVPFYGKVALNIDSSNINNIIKDINRPIISYAIINEADIVASNIQHNNSNTQFEVINKINNEKFKIKINCPGIHNVYNALAAISIAIELKIKKTYITNGLNKYAGVKRRFEIKYQNKKSNIIVVDDYAHHPNEIIATIDAAKKGWKNRIITIFQPHLFSRTKDFYLEFATALDLSDIKVITDIYPAREKPIKGVTSQLIIKKMKKNNTYYIPNKNDIAKTIFPLIKKNDLIIIMGAGNIYQITEGIINRIKK